jgi:Tetratricopeptide repeat
VADHPEAASDLNATIYFLLHVPKTAGTTVETHLATHCAAGALWRPARASILGALTGRRFRIREVPDLTRVRALGGHFLGRSLERYFPNQEIRRAVLLRDPVGFHVSSYNYWMMHHLAMGRGTYSFDLYMRSLPRDRIAHFLLSHWLEIPWPVLIGMGAERKYELLNNMLKCFWFVGAYTDCDRLIAAIAPELGVPVCAKHENTVHQWQKRVEWRALTVADLSAATRDSILALNPIDSGLWHSWRSARFDTMTVRPTPLAGSGTGGFLAHEIVRSGFSIARGLLRELPRLRSGRSPGIALADRARDQGDWPRAALYYRQALDRMPNLAAIWVQYGHALKESGDVAAAEMAYRRSLELEPDAADTHLQLGHALKLQRRVTEAGSAYLHALALDPRPRDAWEALIALGWKRHRIQHALHDAPSSSLETMDRNSHEAHSLD